MDIYLKQKIYVYHLKQAIHANLYLMGLTVQLDCS